MTIHKLAGAALVFCGWVLIAAAGTNTALQTMPATVRSVVVVCDPTLTQPARHGITALEDALRAKRIAVSEDTNALAKADVAVLAGLAAGTGPAARTLRAMTAQVPSVPESLAIRIGARYEGRPAVVLAGGDEVGLMYAALDTADRLGWATSGHPFQFVRDTIEKPFLERRGVVIFTMNRAYFESRLFDTQYLARFFDMFARDRINQLVVTFGYEHGGYMSPPYPYFFDVDGFPDVKVVGLTPEQQARNRTGFRTMLQMASARGVHVKVGIWDHIYRAGVQRGGITTASDGTKPSPSLVWGLNGDNLAAFTIAGLRKFYETFPEIAETQFRMHTESGLRVTEIEPFWHEVFGFFSRSKRDMPLELRVKELPKSVIRDAAAQGLTINLDTKWWMEQMGLPFHPTHINTPNQKEARHSYADLLEYPQTYHMDWTLWNGGTQRLLLWGDPDYVQRMAQNARLYDGRSLSVTEMQATKLLGEPADVAPRDFLNGKYRYFDYEFERYWAFYRTWGRLLYNPETKPEVWDREFELHFGPAAAPHVSRALALASRVLPRIVAASYRYQMFPTTVGWAEMQHMGSLLQFAQQEDSTDIAQFMNVRERATAIMRGTESALRRPEETSHWFADTSTQILTEIAAAERAIGAHVSSEFTRTATDVRMLAALARYHAWRQLGAVNYNLYKQAGDLAAFDEALVDERHAVDAWRAIVSAAGDVYSENIAYGPTNRMPRHWKDELAALEREFAQLEAERRAVVPRPDAKPVTVAKPPAVAVLPNVALQSPSVAVPGQPVQIRADVTAPSGVKWMRLRYRHVNQMDDYETVEMTRDLRTGAYTGAIPGAFVTSQWDLMYYVELVDGQGNGRIYPDLDITTPYVVVKVKRP